MIKIITLIGVLLTSYAHSATNNQFNNFFNSLTSFSADFVQKTYADNNSLLAVNSGEALFSRPYSLLWHIKKPSEQILSVNKDRSLFVDFELEQVSISKKQDLSKTVLYWFINKPDLISRPAVFLYSKEGVDWYGVRNDTEFVSFAFKGDLLFAISIKNQLEQTMVVNFTNVKINQPIKADAFVVKINPNFDVVNYNK